MTIDELSDPPTEAEVADLLMVTATFPDPLRCVLRRLAFQRDRLAARVAELEKIVAALGHENRELRSLVLAQVICIETQNDQLSKAAGPQAGEGTQ